MGLSVWALIVYLAIIIAWTTVIKRGIAEGMIVAFLALCAFGGSDFFNLVWIGVKDAANQPVVFAALAFTFIGFILSKTGIIEQQVHILNSILGRVRGGAGYVSTVASAGFGAVTHSASANSATVGSVTIPWMENSNWPKKIAASVVAGNAGNGTVIPPSAAFLVLAGNAVVKPVLGLDQFLIAMFVVAGYCVLWRLIVIFYFVRQYRIAKVTGEDLLPLRKTLRDGWTSLLVYLGILIPILLTVGGTGSIAAGIWGKPAIDAINILVWIPVLLGLISMALGRKMLPRTGHEWFGFISSTAPRFKDIGATLVFSFAGSAVLLALGLDKQLVDTLNSLNAGAVITVLIVVLMITIIGGPLSATVATVGGVAFTVMVAAGINPVLAACAILVAVSTEGASPPGGPSIFISAGIAEVSPVKTFVPLIVFYVVPYIVLAMIVAFGLLPIPT